MVLLLYKQKNFHPKDESITYVVPPYFIGFSQIQPDRVQQYSRACNVAPDQRSRLL